MPSIEQCGNYRLIRRIYITMAHGESKGSIGHLFYCASYFMGWLQSADTHTELDNDDLGFCSSLLPRGGGGGDIYCQMSVLVKTHPLIFVPFPHVTFCSFSYLYFANNLRPFHQIDISYCILCFIYNVVPC